MHLITNTFDNSEQELNLFQPMTAGKLELYEHHLKMLRDQFSVLNDISQVSFATSGNTTFNFHSESERSTGIVTNYTTLDDTNIMEEPAVGFDDWRFVRSSVYFTLVSEKDIIEKRSSLITTSEVYKDSYSSNKDAYNSPNDGVYVPLLSDIKSTNKARFRSRIFRSKHDNIFIDTNGNILPDSYIIREVPQKFKRDSNGADIQMLEFVPAQIWLNEHMISKVLVKVQIKDLMFLVHEFSNTQHLVAFKLKNLYNTYIHQLEVDKIGYYESKLHALRDALKDCSDNSEKIDLLRQIIECSENMDAEKFRLRQIRDTMVEFARELYKIQKETYIEEGIRLKWMTTELTEEERRRDEVKREEDIKKRAQNIYDLNALLEKENKPIESFIDDIKREHNKLGIGVCEEKIWVPKIIQTEKTPFDVYPLKDKNRIKKLKRTGIFLKIYFGEATVTTPVKNIKEIYKVNINFGVDVLVTRAPKFAKIEIWEVGVHGTRYVADCSIPVFNGQNLSYHDFEFASEYVYKDGRIAHGFLTARAFIITDDYMCELVKRERKSISEVIKKHDASNTSFKTFRHNQTNYLVDPNDPKYIEAYNRNNTVFVPNISFTRFQLDSFLHMTKLGAYAPTVLHKSKVPFLQYTDETNNSYKKINVMKYEDVIYERPFPGFLKFFCSLFSKFRPLRPAIQNTVSPSLNRYSNLVITITGVKNEPRRSKLCFISKELKKFGYNSVNSPEPSIFFIARYGRKKESTEPVKLQNGCYNGRFEFCIGDKIGESSPSVFIDMYDSCMYKFPGLIKPYHESHHLGFLELPISALVFNQSVKGEFVVKSPPLDLCYTYSKNNITLNMSYHFVPSIVSERKFFSFYIVEGKQVPLSCLLNPITLPFSKCTISNLLRYVSLIPCCPPDANLINSTQVFIDNGVGTPLEHAILLCNYMISLGKDAKIVLVNDKYVGEGAYVLIDSKYIDPVNNTFYNSIPLGKAWVVATPLGVWENIDAPLDDYDLLNSKKWKLVYSQEKPPLFQDIYYNNIDIVSANRLGKSIRKRLKSEIQNFVNYNIVWNKSIVPSLVKIIENCENAANKKGKIESIDFFSDTYNLRLIGHPFSLSYSHNYHEVDDIILESVSIISRQKTYEIKGPDTMLALAVSVFPYSHGIASVWVFLCSIQRLPREK